MISPEGEQRAYLTVVLPTSMPQIMAPLGLGFSFSGVLISITPGSRMRGAIFTKLPSGIEESSLIAFAVSGGRVFRAAGFLIFPGLMNYAPALMPARCRA